ncbi:uncharacterized protein LOC119456998 [Dermacentor silvarum]|nr:uncharacterized protein LOC119456998 [Dermacentor silvarum]
MGKSVLICLLLCPLSVLCVRREQPSSDALAYTKSGVLRGSTQMVMGKPVDTFFGIPFAQPPVGDLRFKKPVPVKPWGGIRNATRLPPPCVQIELELPMTWTKSKQPASEDCLYLNVWAPPCSQEDCNCSLKNILVNVYGGGYSVGSSDWDIYDGAALASIGDVVYANMNYRVGAFGFLNGKVPEAPGNQGLFDTLLAIKWIKENAVAFGGNPDKITLFGESAGAVTVGYFLVSPLARGIVNRVIMQSGSPYWRIGDNTDSGPQKLLDVAKKVGCADAAVDFRRNHESVMHCMRTKVSAEAILEAGRQMYGKKHSSAFFPSYGDEFLPQDPVKSFESGDFDHKTPVLLGTNQDEGSVFLTTILPEIFPPDGVVELSKDEAGFYLILMFQYLMGKTTTEVRDFYFKHMHNPNTSAVLTAASDAVGDYAFTCPVNYFAKAVSRRGGDVYYYYYTHRSARTNRSEWMGVAHFEEFPFVVGLPFWCDLHYPEEEIRFSRRVMDIWVTFAKNGSPPRVNGTDWPKYTEEAPYYMELNPKHFHVGRGVHEHSCRYWRKHIVRDALPGVIISVMTLYPASTNDSVAATRTGADGGARCLDNASKVLQVAAPGTMSATRFAIFLTVAAAAAAFASAAKIYRPAVYTTSGKLVGLKKEAFGRPIDVFYGIPYAQPPLDELRFQKPVPVTPWKGLRDASTPPFPCKQPDFFVHQNYTIQTRNSTEDCLYLNVWTPARYCRDIKTCGPKAVMVFIHGGAFTYGSSSWSFYDGIHFASTGDVVVVTLNYRVGPFGFFSSGLDGLNGNQGMYDQILALTWVKSNIKHFGGDPELITVFGQSAGAISVGYLLVSPLSRGLFRRAIMESGSPFWMLHDNRDTALQKSFSLANALGCTTGFEKIIEDPRVMACLRSKDASEIVSVATEVLGPQAETFFPSRDGELFPDDANVLMDAMKTSGVELLIGNNKNEGTYFVYNFLAKGLKFHNLAHITKDELGFYMVLFFRTMLQSGVNEIREFYLDKLNSTDPEVILQRGSDAVGDFLITCPSRYFAEKYQRKGQPVYYYQFSHKPSFSVWPQWMGATHFDEFPFVFAHVMAFPELVTPEEVALSRQLVEIWTTFAKIGRMPTLGKIAWPRYSAAGPYMVDINLKVLTIKKGPQEENCNFWRRYFKLDG